MNPEEVPAELVAIGARGIAAGERSLWAYEDSNPFGFDDDYVADLKHRWEQQSRDALAAVIPEIQALALEDLAADLSAEYEARTAKVGSYGQTKIRAALLTGAGYARERATRLRGTTTEGPTS